MINRRSVVIALATACGFLKGQNTYTETEAILSTNYPSMLLLLDGYAEKDSVIEIHYKNKVVKLTAKDIMDALA